MTQEPRLGDLVRLTGRDWHLHGEYLNLTSIHEVSLRHGVPVIWDYEGDPHDIGLLDDGSDFTVTVVDPGAGSSRSSNGGDQVEHPSHYNNGLIEVWDFLSAQNWWRGYFKGNIVKYAVRAGEKTGEDEAKDVRKIIQYANKWLKNLEEGK